MTRFARAKGSKSSNERVPEEATPWSELKRGMLMKKEVVSEEAKKFVADFKCKTEDEKPVEWASLDDGNEDSLSILKKHLQKGDKAKANPNSVGVTNEDPKNIKKKKRKQVVNRERNVEKDKAKGYIDSQANRKDIKNMNKGEKRKKTKQATSEHCISDTEVLKMEKVGIRKKDNAGKKKKKKILDLDTSQDNEHDQNDDTEKIVKKKRKLDKNPDDVEGKTLFKKKKMKTFAGGKSLKKKSNAGTGQNNIPKKYKSSENGKKKSDDKLVINIGGEMVKIEKFQGFYVTEEDSKRLKELRRKMMESGIPQNQIEGTIKLERRRCEKALSRMKKNVCFQCRKPGHLLSQCPEAQENLHTSTGVCYKCGSTEHKAFSCKVTKGQKFPFAECFICKEKGHIARECPDNPRGLYPKGGCCKLCGDVTHLKKDCPKRIAETEEKTIKLGLVDDTNLEGLDNGNVKSVPQCEKKQKKKFVCF